MVMNRLLSALRYFSVVEYALWGGSVSLVVLSFLLFDRSAYGTLAASLIGVTSLIFTAKGNPFGQMLMVLFSLLYGYISFTIAYYGEMLTYLGMTAPMAVISCVAWLKNPYRGNRAEVTVNRMRPRMYLRMGWLTVVVTVFFYFVLSALGTANLVPSTLSVATSFVAVYLTACRSPLYALAYAANDVVLVVLWVLASGMDRGYTAVVVCFIVFFINDLYGFIGWRRLARRQRDDI